MKDSKEAIHLCPICVCVEMEFLERIPNKTAMRTRRFKCPVCDHTEMYVMGGPHDARNQESKRDDIKTEKALQYGKRHNLFGQPTYND